MLPSRTYSGLAVAASFAVLGCGEMVIDSGKAEKLITKTVTEQTGVRVRSVSCPKDPKEKKGARFTCAVTATDGTKGVALAVQRDDKGYVVVSVPFLHVRTDAAHIAQEIEQQTGATVKVTCPEIVVPRKGGSFECHETGTRTRLIEVTMTDDVGNVRFTEKK
jgi:hypothetical protein